MDPDANLREQRVVARRLIALIDALPDDTIHDMTHHLLARKLDEITAEANRLADLVQALDGWIAGAGFLPKAWQR